LPLFKDIKDYYRHSESCLKSGRKEEAYSLFGWEMEQEKKALSEKNYEKADYFFLTLSSILTHKDINYYKRPGLYDVAREWVLEHFGQVKEAAFAGNTALSRKESGFLFVKFAKDTGNIEDLIAVSVFIYQTLRFAQRYLYTQEAEKQYEQRFTLSCALIGSYRYGITELVKNLMVREPLAGVHKLLGDDKKKLYDELESMLANAKRDTAFFTFAALSDFYSGLSIVFGHSFSDGVIKGINKESIKQYLEFLLGKYVSTKDDFHTIFTELSLVLDNRVPSL
jgi:hypothetical protein